jgi:hypothetical protein
MHEAMLRTTASPAATWAIVVIMTILAAVLVSAAMVADVYGVRSRKTANWPPWEDPVPGVTANQAAVAVPAAGPMPAESEAPTLSDLPAVPASPSLPRQRTGEGDRAERDAAGSGSLWDILPGQQEPR